MEYAILGTSGIEVSRLCLGTMMFGGPTDEAEAARIMPTPVGGSDPSWSPLNN